jgi:hypothetical protein
MTNKKPLDLSDLEYGMNNRSKAYLERLFQERIAHFER